MVLKVLMRGTTFPYTLLQIGSGFWMKNREALGFEFEENLVEFLLGTSNLDET
jgi:hypothetical protein